MRPGIIICFVLIIAIAGKSQKQAFIRIFDETRKKINKGFLIGLSDSSITVATANKTTEIPLSHIGTIKLRRSFGHTVLITSAVSAGAFAIAGVVTADPDAYILGWTAGEGATSGLLFGSGVGAIIGSITGGTRSRPVFIVNMSPENWAKVKILLKNYLPKISDNNTETIKTNITPDLHFISLTNLQKEPFVLPAFIP